MSIERNEGVRHRAALHAALGDPGRLRVVESLAAGDASPSGLGALLGIPSNLLAHHLKVLEREGVVRRQASEGDRRRSYVSLVPGALEPLAVRPVGTASRVVFVCTANSARSHLAAALWRRASDVPADSAGTHPAPAISAGALDSAERIGLELPRIAPRHLEDVRVDGDLVVTVCDCAHEELDVPVDLHWSVADPVPAGTPDAFDRALGDLRRRVDLAAPLVRSPAGPERPATSPIRRPTRRHRPTRLH